MGKRVPQKLKNAFAAELKAWRERRNLTQAEAAEALGLPSVRTLQNWEIGRTMPPSFTLPLLRKLMR
jgi:DNA-binding transcriptional regulator YiaG